MKTWKTDNSETEDIIEEFTAAEDAKLDKNLVEEDIFVNIAHTQMLHEQGYLNSKELKEIHSALVDIYSSKGQIEISTQDEDVHSKLENLVTERTEAGKKMHTGRSRNDQVLTDTRLYTKKKLIKVALEALELSQALDEKGCEEEFIIPGYTHLRQAMPTTPEVWLGSYAGALLDDLELLETTFALNDQNPLGAAAGYGTTLDINRERTAELLGFSEVQSNPTYCIGSRGKMELEVVSSLVQIMLDLGKLSNDLILFSTAEFDFVEIPSKFCTGSSIMPQKSNPDPLELVKGKASQLIGNQTMILSTLKNSYLGYNRDTQVTKKALMESLEQTKQCLTILAKIIPELKFKKERIEEKTQEEIFATYTANQLVDSGTPFREAYEKVKSEEEYEVPDVREIPSKSVNPERLEKEVEKWEGREENFEQAKKDLLELARKNSQR